MERTIQIQLLLKLNDWYQQRLNQIASNSNTTLVKVKSAKQSTLESRIYNSNTTLVKVKYYCPKFQGGAKNIQIQLLLKLN